MTNKNNISRSMSTLPKLTKFNGGGDLHLLNHKYLINSALDNIQGERFLHSGVLRLGFFMLFSILVLTSCSNTENVPKPQQMRHGNASAVELVYDTVCPTDSIPLD